jgi:hypothetical protein
MKKNVLMVFFLVVAAIAGFFVGRKTINTETKIEYIEQEPVSGSVVNNQLQPVKEKTPTNPHLPVRVDTVYSDSIRTEIKYIVQKVDTAAIIADYMIKRSYDITAFKTPELGELKLFPTIQYNQLTGLDYNFTPITKTITVYREKVWQQFLSGSYSTLGSVGIGGGTFYHNLGFEYQYQKDIGNKSSSHLFGLKYKF